MIGLVHPHAEAVIGTRETFPIQESLGILLLLKAFGAGARP